MTPEQLGYKLASLFLSLVLFLIIGRIGKWEKYKWAKNISIVIFTFVMLIALFTFFGVEAPFVLLLLTIIVSALFIREFNKK